MSGIPIILDCTLRDGSYAIDRPFAVADTARICAALEAAGVTLIEVGPGMGLGATRAHAHDSPSDEEYLAAAAGALSSARFGAFYIPGIGTPDCLELARDHGMHFVRIGTNVHQYHEARPHIEHARRIGLQVSYNAMKSYVAEPATLATIAAEVADWGAQEAYVVDSAGTFTPADAKAYVTALTDRLDIPVGFHGHNNLMLANANCLAAWEAGACRLDGTLQGLGRSGGNAQTEILAVLFQRMNVPTGLDLMALLRAGETLVRPLMGRDAAGGATSLNILIGMAGFHSSQLDKVTASAERFGIDRDQLILAVCQRDRVDPSPALIDEIASRLADGPGKDP